MSDTQLVTRNQAQDFQGVMDGIIKERFQETAQTFTEITTFEDLKRSLLMGKGDSRHTYRAYTTGIEQFWNHTEGRVLTASTADVESFFDDICAKASKRTAAARLVALRRFYKELEARIPYYEGPFQDVPEKLKRKFNPKTESEIQALGLSELKAILAYLAQDTSEQGLRDYALLHLAFNTGLRAAEISGLTWGDLEYLTDKATWYARGIGKGGKPFKQPLLTETVDALRAYHSAVYRRDPRPEDPLLLTTSTVPHPKRVPLRPNSLWVIFRRIGQELRARGILTRTVTFSPHLARRSYCTILHDLGMSPAEIKVLSRHSSYDTLLKHYLKVTPDVQGVLGTALVASN